MEHGKPTRTEKPGKREKDGEDEKKNNNNNKKSSCGIKEVVKNWLTPK